MNRECVALTLNYDGSIRYKYAVDCENICTVCRNRDGIYNRSMRGLDLNLNYDRSFGFKVVRDKKDIYQILMVEELLK